MRVRSYYDPSYIFVGGGDCAASSGITASSVPNERGARAVSRSCCGPDRGTMSALTAMTTSVVAGPPSGLPLGGALATADEVALSSSV